MPPHEVVSLVRRHLAKPLIVKLTPNVTDITIIARAVEEAGADAISCINTITGMAIDIRTRQAAIRQPHRRALRPGDPAGSGAMVHQVVQAVKIPVIGIGGIMPARSMPWSFSSSAPPPFRSAPPISSIRRRDARDHCWNRRVPGRGRTR